MDSQRSFRKRKTSFYYCSGGRNGTGTLETGVLLKLGHTSFVEEAVQKAKEIVHPLILSQE
ncbi:hypothetical protein P5770_19730 [Bacillus cereus]|nr:hypothetical protein [Bacillus cereus]